LQAPEGKPEDRHITFLILDFYNKGFLAKHTKNKDKYIKICLII